MNSIYSNEDRMAIWQYKYLEYPIEKFSKTQREKIEYYLNEEEQGLHRSKIYTETFYQPHEHNNIQYDVNKKVDEYIKEDEETTNFTIVNNNQYQIQSNNIFRNIRKPLLSVKNENLDNDDDDDDDDDDIVIRNQILKY